MDQAIGGIVNTGELHICGEESYCFCCNSLFSSNPFPFNMSQKEMKRIHEMIIKCIEEKVNHVRTADN